MKSHYQLKDIENAIDCVVSQYSNQAFYIEDIMSKICKEAGVTNNKWLRIDIPFTAIEYIANQEFSVIEQDLFFSALDDSIYFKDVSFIVSNKCYNNLVEKSKLKHCDVEEIIYDIIELAMEDNTDYYSYNNSLYHSKEFNSIYIKLPIEYLSYIAKSNEYENEYDIYLADVICYIESAVDDAMNY